MGAIFFHLATQRKRAVLAGCRLGVAKDFTMETGIRNAKADISIKPPFSRF